MGLDFFGLNLENSQVYRKNLFTQIHNIVFHGNGGYDWFTIYNMPIWLRKFTFHEIDQYNKDQNKKQEAAAKGKGKTAQEEIWNMVPSCAKCNLTCNTKNLMDFMDDSIMMRPHIKPLLFLKVKSIIRSQMDCCPLSIKEILSEKNW